MLAPIMFLGMLLRTAKALLLDKQDGGYVRLLIAIDDSIKKDPALLDGIQTLFSEASSVLDRVTHHKVHFKQVTVALPQGWAPMVEQRGTTIERVAYRAYPHAQVRILSTDGKSGNEAISRIRAFNIHGCGHRGDHIDVPEDALRGIDDAEWLRRTAFSLVREWIHFRYGVTDDLGKPGSLFYPDVNCSDSKYRQLCTGASAYDRDEDRRFCSTISSWDIISQSEDLKSLPPGFRGSLMPTTFRFIREDPTLGRRLALVLGISGSPQVLLRLDAIKDAVSTFLREGLPSNTRVALVTFSENQTLRSPLSNIDNDTKVMLLRQVEEVQPVPQLCSNCGVLVALQALSSGPTNYAEGSAVILATDSPIIDTTPTSNLGPLLLGKGILFHSITLSVNARSDLEQLASETGGSAFVAVEAEAVFSALMDAASSTMDLTAEKRSSRPIIKSVAAHGQEINKRWNSKDTMTAMRESTEMALSITLTPRVPPIVKKFKDANVYATLKVNNYAVVHANVTAKFVAVSNTITAESTMALLDEGLGADNTARDGIYTGLFTKFVGSLRFSVTITATNTPFTVYTYTVENKLLEVASRKVDVQAQRQIIEVGTGSFNLNKAYLSMNVQEELYEKDVPPGRVQSLKISSYPPTFTADNRPVVTLSWYSCGDHAYDGKAASLELRGATTLDSIQKKFDTCHLVNPQADLVNGSLTPMEVYEKHTVVLAVPKVLIQELENTGQKTVFFGVKSISSTGVPSQEPQPHKYVGLPTPPTPGTGVSLDISVTQSSTEVQTAGVGKIQTSTVEGTSATEETSTTVETSTTEETITTKETTGMITTTTQVTTPKKATTSKRKKQSTSSVQRKEEQKTTSGNNDEGRAESYSANDLNDGSSNLVLMIVGLAVALATIAVCAGIAYLATSKKSTAVEAVPPPNEPGGKPEGTSVAGKA